jgi:hypothetical protein
MTPAAEARRLHAHILHPVRRDALPLSAFNCGNV